MKLLEYSTLESINEFLSNLNLGERTIKGCLEAYSCNYQFILDYLGKTSDMDSSSPADYLLSRSNRKTLSYLTLCHMYPDYDFSAMKARQFFTEENWDTFKQILDIYLFEASKMKENEGDSLLVTSFKALDEVVKLAECEIYSYNADPFLEKGAIQSFNFFFYNRKLKRVVRFHFCCLSLVVEGYLLDNSNYEGDEE
ncbi:hypothetical protein P3X46_031436 [Hevea brasiliensis]|uniref:Uncharacterized protein n=1 Tax=Hevea brasiliensis TaxID=3981 RepID=A0ABQ9KM02_HEVBR|nr:hypothetical protein P3X46_031436 [Hevea brasiliensis]